MITYDNADTPLGNRVNENLYYCSRATVIMIVQDRLHSHAIDEEAGGVVRVVTKWQIDISRRM